MACTNLTTMWVSSKLSISDSSSLSFRSILNPLPLPNHNSSPSRSSSVSPIQSSLRELRDRIDSVKNTQKITEAMKLVAAAKVRRAQEAVVNGRPFSETLVEVLYNINEQLQTDDIDVPLTKIRPVKKVALVVVTGDRGLCGGFNNFIIKKAEARIKELQGLGLDYTVISVGKKGNSYFLRRPYIPVDKYLEAGTLPTAKEAQAVADDVFSLFISEEVDKVELLYTKFVSLVKSEPVIHTLLPLSPKGEICDINGNCVDAAEDELFRLTTKEGKLTVERETFRTPTADFSPILQFEQDPVQILDALLPLYLNSQILRALQESLASELAARMSAMSSASDNASDLKKSLSMVYNRKRQAKITGFDHRTLVSLDHRFASSSLDTDRIAMAKNSFKLSNPLKVRMAESTRIREKYQDRVPVIVEKAGQSDVPDIDKKKYLVPADLTVGQFVYVVRKRIKLGAEKAIFVFVKNTLPPTASLMSAIYEEHKDEDGFLYMTYSGENTFGSASANIALP
ncbi:unnamed protein product [Brassica napus]|nr:unnamed protein product [Brassica napus]